MNYQVEGAKKEYPTHSDNLVETGSCLFSGTAFARQKTQLLYLLLLGQLLSIFITTTGATSNALTLWHQISLPITQNWPNYFLLFIVYSGILLTQKRFCIVFREKRLWSYLILAISDVEANYLVVKAYQYTNLTSVMLLDCITIPTVVFLSLLFLKIRYFSTHYLGVVFCLSGIVVIAINDYFYADSSSPHMLWGDLLCLSGAFLYGFNNVAQEFLVKKFDLFEYLAFLGFFGTLVCSIQAGFTEFHLYSSIEWNTSVFLYFFGYTISMFLFYSFVPIFLSHPRGGATFLNLSLLTSDFFAVIVGYFLFHFSFSYLYGISFCLVILGIISYSFKPFVQISPFP